MAVTKEWSKLKNSAVRLYLKYSKEDLNAEYDKILKDVLKDAVLPGFRRGKVPREVFERKAGEKLKTEALNQIMGDTVVKVMEGEDLPAEYKPLGYLNGEIEQKDLKLDLAKGLDFSVVYDVKPVLNLEKTENFEVTPDYTEVEEADIGRELENVRERNSVIMEKEDGAQAKEGDIITVDYKVFDSEGKIDEDASRVDAVFTVGKKNTLYRFDDEITGMKKGDTRNFEKSYAEKDFDKKEFPPGAVLPAFIGKTLKFEVTCKSVREKQLPALDDELAQDVSEKFKTLDDLKASIRETLEKKAKKANSTKKRDALLDAIIAANPFELPVSMVSFEIAVSMRNTLAGLLGGQITQEQLAQIGRGGPPYDEMKPAAEKRIRYALTVNELVKKLNIEVSAAEAQSELEKLAADEKRDVDELKEEFEKNLSFKQDIEKIAQENKIFDILESKNTVKKGKKVPLEEFLKEVNGGTDENDFEKGDFYE